jgi:mannitol/fructose-specific phosphotransferase system IIA component (Ntr-type)
MISKGEKIMQLSHLLNKDLIFWNIQIESINSLYKKVAATVSQKSSVSENDIYDAFIKRGDLGYVVFPDGSVIPHGRIENFDDLIIVIVKTQDKLDISDRKADLFYFLLTSKAGSNRYLKTLAAFASISKFHSQNIRNCTNPDEIIKFISDLNIHVDKIVRVQDIISETLFTVKKDDPISKVADIMKKHKVFFLPVVDENNTYLGKIDILDIMRIAYPEYTMLLNDISFLSNMRAFEDFEKEEETSIVADIYNRAENKIINRNSNVLELGYLFVKNKWHHITVVDDDKRVISVISTSQFLENILRA